MRIKDKLALMRRIDADNDRRVKGWNAEKPPKCGDCRYFQRSGQCEKQKAPPGRCSLLSRDAAACRNFQKK